MLVFLAFILGACATRLYDIRAARRDTKSFREMTPQQLRDLYDRGGSIKVVTPLGWIVRPLIGGAVPAIVVATIF